MDHSSGSDGSTATSLSSQRPKTQIARIDFSVVTDAGCALSWKIFSECEQWNKFLPAYGRIQWFGERWAAGSRLQIELTYPASVIQDRVITACSPPRCVGWINHVMGFTMEQWVLFDPCAGGKTRISTWIEFTGPTLEVEGHDVPTLVRTFVERWYTNFAAECDRMAACT
jgi:hypothetical protein